MLECIKFDYCKIKTIQIEDELFVSVCHIGISLGVSLDPGYITSSFTSAI